MEKKGRRSPDCEMEIEDSSQTKVDSPPSNSEGDESAYFSAPHQPFSGDETDEDVCYIDELEKTMDITVDCLQINYKYLKSEMEPNEILDHLYAGGLFSERVLETCKECPERRRRNDLIIKNIYHIAKAKESDVLQYFVKVLNKTGHSHIVKQLMEQDRQSRPIKHKSTNYVGFLRKMNKSIAENVEPREVIDDLLESKAISFHDHEDVDLLPYRKERVQFILEKARETTPCAVIIAGAIMHAYPKLLHEYRRNNGHNTETQQGTAISIRMHLRSDGRKESRKPFRQIEKKIVENFDSSKPSNNDFLEDLEECISRLEGLKFSSVVIQLVTEAGDALEKVLSMIKSGKAVDWLMSFLDEADKQYLEQRGTTRLLVTVAVDRDGNFNNLQPVGGCLCLLDKCNIRDNMTRLLEVLSLNDVDKVMQQIKLLGYKIPNVLKEVPEKNLTSAFLECLINDDTPRICYCLLEELIKSTDPGFLSTLFSSDLHEDIMLSKSQVKQHEQFLTEELEVRMYLQVIRSRENEKSRRVLENLEKIPYRNVRVSKFLKFLLREEDLSWFWDEVKQKQKYIWDSVISSERNITQFKQDLLAVKLLNDQIVDDIDPLRLMRYMDAQSVQNLGFSELEKLLSRKLQAQYLLNRLSTDTVGAFLVALRRSGYTHLESQIKAGSLSKEYVCPRIHHGNPKKEKKHAFKGHFYIHTTARLLDVGNKGFDWNQTVKDWKLSSSQSIPAPRYFLRSMSAEESKSANEGSQKDSESGIFSDPEELSCEVSYKSDFDDEGIALQSPRNSIKINIDSSVLNKIEKGQERMSDVVLPETRLSEYSCSAEQTSRNEEDIDSSVLNKIEKRQERMSDVVLPETKLSEYSCNAEQTSRNEEDIDSPVLKKIGKRQERKSDVELPETRLSEYSCSSEQTNRNEEDIDSPVLKKIEKRQERKSDAVLPETRLSEYSCSSEQTNRNEEEPCRKRNKSKSSTDSLVLKKIKKRQNTKSIGVPPKTKIAWQPDRSCDAEQKNRNEEETMFRKPRALPKYAQMPEQFRNKDSKMMHGTEQKNAIPKTNYRAVYRSLYFDEAAALIGKYTRAHFGDKQQCLKSFSDAFHSSCSMKTAQEERSNSSPPGKRDRINNNNEPL